MRWLSPRALGWACLALVGVAIGSRVALQAWGVWWTPVFVLTFCRMDMLVIGALLALTLRTPHGVRRLGRAIPWLAAGSAVVLVGIVARTHGFDRRVVIVGDVGYTALACLFGALVARAATAPPASTAARILSNRPLMALGKYSYAIYLIHRPLHDLLLAPHLRPWLARPLLGSRLPGQIADDVIATAVTFVLALASWHLSEKHLLRLKRFFPSR